MAKKRQRILVYRLGSLGDTVVALPVMHLVRRAFPEADVRLLTNFPVSGKAAAAAAVLEGSGLVDGYFQYPTGARQFGVLARLWSRLLFWRADAIVYLAAARGVSVARRDSLFFRACGISKQYGLPLSEELQQNAWQPERDCYEPEYERLARTVAALGDARIGEQSSWDLKLSIDEEQRAQAALEPAGGRALIAFSIGTKFPTNDWGHAAWHELLSRLGALYAGHALFFTGVAGESDASEAVAAGWRLGAGAGSPVLNLCGKLTPRESAACFRRASVFLGHDSGPMHLAACVGTPVVAIFSARVAPRVWFPHGERHRVVYHRVDCMGCGLSVCTIEQMKCIRSITVEEVVAAVRATLD